MICVFLVGWLVHRHTIHWTNLIGSSGHNIWNSILLTASSHSTLDCKICGVSGLPPTALDSMKCCPYYGTVFIWLWHELRWKKSNSYLCRCWDAYRPNVFTSDLKNSWEHQTLFPIKMSTSPSPWMENVYFDSWLSKQLVLSLDTVLEILTLW